MCSKFNKRVIFLLKSLKECSSLCTMISSNLNYTYSYNQAYVCGYVNVFLLDGLHLRRQTFRD